MTIPGEVLLNYLVVTGAEPLWLLTGIGEKFRAMTPNFPVEAAV